jgi:hypothetical protein
MAVEVVTADDLGPSDRVLAALHAAAAPPQGPLAGDGSPPLAPEAIPDVDLVGGTIILDWSSTEANDELGAWSTSSGSTGLNAIAGMVFANAPEVDTIEHRLDGSCARFTEAMQGSGCNRDTRARWEAFVAG